MKYILLTGLLATIFDGYTQDYYYTGWDDSIEQAGWTQFRKGDTSPYEWMYDSFSYYSPSNSLGHNYPVGGSVPTDDWFVSPMFDFSWGGAIDSMYTKYSGFGTPMSGDTIALYLLDGNQDPDLATKTLLYNFTDSTYMNDDVWYQISQFDIPTASPNCYLAFRYKTVVNWLDVRFDNFYIKSFIGSGINESEVQLNLFPNPASNILHIGGISIQRFEIFDLSGSKVMTGNSTQQIDVSSLKRGLYFIDLTYEGGSIMKKFTKI